MLVDYVLSSLEMGEIITPGVGPWYIEIRFKICCTHTLCEEAHAVLTEHKIKPTWSEALASPHGGS